MLLEMTLPVLFDGTSLSTICDKRRGFYCWINTSNGKRYVGMAAGSLGFYGRISNELTAFRRGNHHGTVLLGHAVAKYGIESFRVVELCDFSGSDDSFGDIERAFISCLNTAAPLGYNLTPGGKGTLGFSSLASADKKRGVPRPDVAAAKARRYNLVSPKGVLHHITNLAAFSRALGFGSSSLHCVASGKSASYKGWRLATKDPKEYAKTLSNLAFFVSPVGELIRVFNIKSFANTHGLGQGAMNGLWTRRKHYNTCKGWRRATEEEIRSFDSQAHRSWNFDCWGKP